MTSKWLNKVLSATLIILLFSILGFSQSVELDKKPPKYPNESRGGDSTLPKESKIEKLSPELQILIGQFRNSRGGESEIQFTQNGIGGFTAQQFEEIFGVKSDVSNPTLNLSLYINTNIDNDELKKAGAEVYFRLGNTVYVKVPVSNLANLNNMRAVKRIGLLKSMSIPEPPSAKSKPSFDFLSRGGESLSTFNTFNRQNLTGKGVIVGIIDSGIDWTHPDFISADGTSRILAIWDITDNSFVSSGGKIGTSPPILKENNTQLPGTIYTNQQINDALKKKGQVNSIDKVGHGTAVAGTAVGNGRAAGELSESYKGIAPEADLIVVKVGDCNGSGGSLAAIGAYWVATEAQKLKRPTVLNLSLGTHFSSHDGSNEEEEILNFISDSAKGFGIPVIVAAGNEGRLNIQANSRFGARKEGQMDVESKPIEATVSRPSILLGNFASKDDWGLYFRSTNPIFKDVNDKQSGVFLFKRNGEMNFVTESKIADENNFKLFLQNVEKTSDEKTDSIMLSLPVGEYVFFGFGVTASVTNGKFNLYLPNRIGASFGMGTEKKYMVSSPGNATNVITVGSFDFRNEWQNQSGKISRFNLENGEVSDYSNPGPRRDGLIKPEIVAPGRYMISSLSTFSFPENGGCQVSMVSDEELQNTYITKSGKHLAWSGTSAATPFVTGVVALMLQKNPNLKAPEIKQILIKTAVGRNQNGRISNDERLGYGRISPEDAIKNTPAVGVKVTGKKKK